MKNTIAKLTLAGALLASLCGCGNVGQKVCGKTASYYGYQVGICDKQKVARSASENRPSSIQYGLETELGILPITAENMYIARGGQQDIWTPANVDYNEAEKDALWHQCYLGLLHGDTLYPVSPEWIQISVDDLSYTPLYTKK